MSKSNDVVVSTTTDTASNYWNDIKNIIYSSQDYRLTNEQFKELLNKIQINEASIFKFDQVYETFYTSLVH